MPKVAVLLVCAGCALGQQALAQDFSERDPAIEGSVDIPLTPGRSNAALQYHTYWMLLEPLLEFDGLSDGDVDAIRQGEYPDQYLARIAADADLISRLAESTKLEQCDFGLQYELGIEALLPQLGEFRQSAKLLLADAIRLEPTDMDAAVDRLAAIIRMGEHASQSKTVIGSLVGIAIADLSAEQIRRLLEQGVLNAQHAQVLDTSLDRVLTDDPFHGLNSFETESVIVPIWIKHKYDGEGAGEELSKIFVLVEGSSKEFNREQQLIRRLNGEQIAELVDQMAAGYEDAIEAWGAADPVGEMQRIEQNNERGEYGLAAKLLLPALANFRHRVLEAEQEFENLREQLKVVSKG